MAHKKHEQAILFGYRGLSALIIVVVLLTAASFFAGFFWGQRYKSERFLERFEYETLSDHIYSSMLSLYESGFEPRSGATAEQQKSETTPHDDSDDVAEELSQEMKVAEESDETGNESVDEAVAEVAENVEHIADLSTNYYAQLVGFGSRNRAEAFVKKLASRGIQVQLQKRLGKSPKNGKAITWYQVTTPIFSDRHTLEVLAARLAKEEKLHDIRIITLT